ncbi:MAG TPA: hypothetical protein VHY57_08625, partial [Rhizomicrobium sp.]|nr:hypothetical protein [Rhizomicrobium sp.]
MPELPEVSQTFDANVAGYVSGMEEMILAADAFLAKNQEVIDSVNELHLALDALPDVKIINIIYRQTTEGNAPGPIQVNETLGDQSGLLNDVQAQTDEAAAAARRLTQEQTAAADAMDRYAESALNEARAEAAADADRTDSLNQVRDATQGLIDQAGEYDAALEAQMEAARQLDGQYNVLGQSALRMTDDQKNLMDATLNDMKASSDLGDQIDALATRLGIAGNVARDNAAIVKALEDEYRNAASSSAQWTDAQSASVDATLAAARASALADEANKVLDGDLEKAAVATRATGDAARYAGGWFGWLGTNVTLWGGLLGQTHLVGTVQGWHIALDGAAEAAIALVGATIALGAAAAGMAPSFLDIYNHLTAVRDIVEATGIQMKPFNDWFLQLQKSMAPGVVEIYGGALNAMGKTLGPLSTAAHEVEMNLEDMVAKFDIWIGHSDTFGKVILNGAGY